MAKLAYNSEKSDSFISLKAGAKQAGVSYSRFRKTLQRLKISVTRVGWTVLVPRDAPKQVKKALSDGTIRRGRPPRKETSRLN